MSNFSAPLSAFVLNSLRSSGDCNNLATFSAIDFTSPTLDKKPSKPCVTTSGIPPEFVEITGTPEAIASNAANPKLSVSEGRINKSDIPKSSLVDFKFPRKTTFSQNPHSLHWRSTK